MTTPTWTTKEGRELRIVDMSTAHIENAAAMLKRHPFTSLTMTELLRKYNEGRARHQKLIRAFNKELRRRREIR